MVGKVSKGSNTIHFVNYGIRDLFSSANSKNILKPITRVVHKGISFFIPRYFVSNIHIFLKTGDILELVPTLSSVLLTTAPQKVVNLLIYLFIYSYQIHILKKVLKIG